MKIFLLILFLILGEYVIADDSVDIKRLNSSSGESHICYFSLNNELEFKEMDKFTKKLNKHSKHKITVKEYQTLNDNPEKSFKKMIESSQRCDGLVISGHHTGSFGGKRANGQLSIGFLEKLKCNPKYEDFFKSIKALWLQGCKTLGQDKIVPMSVALTQDIFTSDTSAQHNTLRVGSEVNDDSLESNYEMLEGNYSIALDKDNPIGPRFLKIFSRATTFGWTKSAPGKDAKSELSLPYHIAHISRVLDPDNKQYFKNPTARLTPEIAVRYAQVLSSALQRGNNKFDSTADCLGLTQAKLIEGWKAHGMKKENKLPFTFSNSDLKAFESFDTNEDEKMMRAQSLGCQLGGKNKKKSLKALDEILKDKFLIGANLNIILDLYKSKDQTFKTKVANKLKKSNLFKYFLENKINVNSTGVLTKLGYLEILSQVYGEEIKKNKKKTFYKYALSVLKVKGKNDWALATYKREMLKRMSDLDLGIIEELSRNSGLSAIALKKIADTARNLRGKKKKRILNNLLENKKSDRKVLILALNEAVAETPKDTEKVLFKILKRKNNDEYTMLAVSNILLRNKNIKPDPFINKILKKRKVGSYLLTKLVKLSFSSVSKKSNLKKILKHKKVNKKVLLEMVKDIGKVEFKGKKEIEKILKKRLKNKKSLNQEASDMY